MARYIYRNIGGVASLVVSHSVGDPLVGVRWYEFRPAVLGGAPVLYQQGTLSPDSTYRWMPSISMDSAGDIALVYSASSSALAPGIRVAGRLVGDPHGVLSQGESTLISGTGVQPVEDRWGDYAAMVVDPANGCTFWFASEYLVTDGAYNWHTRIGSFRFPSCTPIGPPPSSTPGPSLTPGPSSSGSPDITPPTVSSLATSGALLTNAATVSYALSFSESVTGLTAGDFTRTGTATSCSVGSPVGSGASYTIAISGCSAGTVILTLNANTVRDLANNLGPTGSASAATVRIDRTGPTATLIAQFSPTNAASLAYQINFNESVTGLTTGDFTRTGTATGCVVFPPLGSGSSYSLAIITCSAGTVLLSLKSASVQDGAGNIGPALAVAAASVTLDRTAPTVTAPAMSLRSGVTVTGSSMPVHLAWTGADTGGAGVKSYDLARSTDAAAFATVATGLTSASYNLSLTSGHSYRFETRAHDAAGNVGGWLAGPTIHPTLLQQTSTSITYYRTWTTSTSTVYSGGSSRHATAAGAYARYSFTGRSISAVLARGPTRGAVKVYIDGVYVSTVNLYSATYSYRYVAFARTWSTSGAHSIKLVVVGTSGRPRVDLDAFEVLR
jgi:hypothetical protein